MEITDENFLKVAEIEAFRQTSLIKNIDYTVIDEVNYKTDAKGKSNYMKTKTIQSNLAKLDPSVLEGRILGEINENDNPVPPPEWMTLEKAKNRIWNKNSDIEKIYTDALGYFEKIITADELLYSPTGNFKKSNNRNAEHS